MALPLRAADMTLAFTPRWAGAPIAVPSGEVANSRGQALRVTRLSALISEVALLRRDGAVVHLDGQYGLLDAADGRLACRFHGVPEGRYSGISFDIGVPPGANHSDPGRWPAGHPLNPLTDRMRWDWQGGYVFLALEGRWKEPGAGEDAEQGFSYHLATDARLMRVRFISLFTVGGPLTVTLAVDLDHVIGALALSAGGESESTHSGAGDDLAPRLAAAVERSVFWLEAQPSAAAAGGGSEAAAGPGTSRTGDPLPFVVPAGFPQPSLPADNPLTVEGVALGKRLFFDPRLSAHHTQSCATCHAPEHAFSDSVPISPGADGARGTRNAMPLFNLAWSPAYAWDGSKPRIRDQALAAMTNPVEMHGDAPAAAAALAADPGMRAGFKAAFGSAAVTPERIGLALEQYLLTIVSADSKFDRAARGGPPLSAEERRGLELFLTEYDPARKKHGADCFHCHGGALFTDFGYRSDGLDLVSADPGRARATGRTADAGKFKTPSLRNVALTAPYMHDGRFATLEQVVAHYDHGVRRSLSLDPNLAKHPDAGLKLSGADQSALVAFLNSLTDDSLAARYR